MKIVDIRAIPLSYRCDPPYGTAGGMQVSRGGLLVEVETDDGITGIGEAGVGGGGIRSLGQEVMPAMREYGKQLGPTDPFEADAPVHLRYSADIKQMPQAAE